MWKYIKYERIKIYLPRDTLELTHFKLVQSSQHSNYYVKPLQESQFMTDELCEPAQNKTKNTTEISQQ